MQIKPSRMVWRKLYKISISQLYECEAPRWEAYFQRSSIQAFLAVQGHLFTLGGFAMPGDHTQAHPDLLIIYANFPASINPQRSPSPV